MQKSTALKWKTLLLSPTLVDKNKSHKIAYISVLTAFIVVANMFFEFKLADTQFSLTLFVSALCGVIIGPLFGFAACFLGDLAGFLYNSGGFTYMPWIGLSMGLTAFFAGLIIGGIKSEKTWFLYVKLALISLLTFGICTVAINTTAFWLLYSKVSYKTYLVTRLFVQGQIWNSLFNYLLLFIAVPILARVKTLKIRLN
ncbi:MAG: ECF transporter S component [Clostridia bacterium]|nr:ECF transporter S component [Clostridia bacterium]